KILTGEEERFYVTEEGIPLTENGNSILVKEENLKEYLNEYAHWKVYKCVEKQVNALLTGMNEVTNDISSLALLFRKKFDIQELKNITKYSNGYHKNDSIIEWFWQILDSWDDENLDLFFQKV